MSGPRPALDGARWRARGALLGLAVGDALGMPTQGFPFAEVQRRYGLLDDFHPGPPDNPISAGEPAGQVTDDTDQALILGRVLVRGNGTVDQRLLVDELLDWERRMRKRGSLDLLGPSTSAALAAAKAGESLDRTGSHGTTNGAAMRITPVGIAARCDPVEDLVAAVHDAVRVTHDTGTAVAGASAVAAAVSSGVAGHPLEESLRVAVTAAEIGAALGHRMPGPDVAEGIDRALRITTDQRGDELMGTVTRRIGTTVATHESVPAAFAVAAAHPTSTWDACRCAASLGGDSDTIAAMAGAMIGAHTRGTDLPARILADLERANPDLGLAALADALVRLRGETGGPP
jgi:ADP-ribosylglycohydrolase